MTLYVRPIAYSRWCTLARAEFGHHIHTRCGATIDQAEAVRIADDVPADERCTACVAAVRLDAVTADSAGLLDDAIVQPADPWSAWFAEDGIDDDDAIDRLLDRDDGEATP